MGARLFQRYIGIDYSGAKTPTSSLPGLRVCVARPGELPQEVPPPPSPRKHWTRRGVAEWLLERLLEDVPTLVGIDHGFSFSLAYFDKHRLDHNWSAFLEDFCDHWPTDGDFVNVDSIREGANGKGSERQGNPRWRRITEQRAGAAKSVFHFDVQGSVAKSTHSGLPWLLYLRRRLANKVHFWPFDGWKFATGSSVVAEVYPALWSRNYEREDRTPDQHDAYSVARWTSEADRDGTLSTCFAPELSEADSAAAKVEGWILGVGSTLAKPVPMRPISSSGLATDTASAFIRPVTIATPTLRLVRATSSRSPSSGKSRSRSETFVHRFLISLADTDPIIWRRIEVPEGYSFWDLHVAIQDAIGWEDRHLHEFVVVNPARETIERIGIPDDEFADAKPRLAGWKIRITDYLRESLPPILYTYDFGDDWRHVVLYEATAPADETVQYPRCVSGARRCPPEDCGGPHGFRELLAAVVSRRQPQHLDQPQHVGETFDPASFDPVAVRFDDPAVRWKRAFERS